MVRLIVDVTPTDQRLLVVGPTGTFTDPARLVWHEGVDGPIPQNLLASIGGLVRQGNQLAVDAQKLSAFQAAETARQQARTARANRLAAAEQTCRTFFETNPATLTNAQLVGLNRAMLIVINEMNRKID
jgi:ABC-type cobalamin transport system ATPase subunit